MLEQVEIHRPLDPMSFTVLLAGDIPHRNSPAFVFSQRKLAASLDHEELARSTKKQK